MNKVWIVFAGDYSDRHTVAVLDNEADVDVIRSAFADTDVEEWETGANGVFDLSRLKSVKRFFVMMDRRGDVLRCDKAAMNDRNWDELETTWYITSGVEARLCVKCFARNEEHAIKIAGEHLTMALVRGDWDDETHRHGSLFDGQIVPLPGVNYELGVVEPVSIGPEE
jgi:hypothetical protein